MLALLSLRRTKIRRHSRGSPLRRVVIAVVATSLLAASTAAAHSATTAREGGPAARAAEGVDHSGKPTLTVAVHSPVISLDLSQEAYQWGVVRPLMHAFLTHQAPDGSIVPSEWSLAESWGYVGEGNQVFELKLREDAFFSDGTPVTAERVKEWFEYFAQGTGINVAGTGPIDTIDVLDEYSLRLNLSAPNPIVPFQLSEAHNWGGVSLVDDPERLSTETLSAGPYRLDPTRALPDEEYVLVPNEYYWDQSAIQWSEVIIKVLPDASARFRAVQTGQVDFAVMGGAVEFAQPAEDAGLQTFAVPANTRGLIIADRDTDGPLGDVRVRQALNYAIDREAITTGLIGEVGRPTSMFRTTDGYDPTYVDHYAYDPDRARELLAEAGYPDGFSVEVLAASHMFVGGGPLAQAIASYWDDIGVTANVTLAPSTAEWVELRATLDYQILSFTLILTPVGYVYGFGLTSEGPPPGNPFGAEDPEIDRLFAEAGVAEEPEPVFQELMRYTADEALFVPVWDEPWLYVANDTVEGIVVTEDRPIASYATEWVPAS